MPFRVQLYQGAVVSFDSTFTLLSDAMRYVVDHPLQDLDWSRMRLIREDEGMNPRREVLLEWAMNPATMTPRNVLGALYTGLGL